MNMAANIVAGTNAAAGADSMQAKADKAGAQFEAILLNMVFGELQRTFSQLPGSTRDGVSKSYDGFGTEALTSGLARSGGIGLGAFIAKALMKQAKQGIDHI
jgi:Rod binding domain-containing protein